MVNLLMVGKLEQWEASLILRRRKGMTQKQFYGSTSAGYKVENLRQPIKWHVLEVWGRDIKKLQDGGDSQLAVGEILLALRLRAGRSCATAACAVGVTRVWLSAVENCQRNPSKDLISKLSSYYGTKFASRRRARI